MSDTEDTEFDDIVVSRKTVLVPWIEKFRPKSVTDIVSQDSVVAAMRKFLETNDVSLLFLSSFSP